MFSLLMMTEGKTLLSVSSRDKEIAEKTGINKTEQAKLVGKLAAEKSKEQWHHRQWFSTGMVICIMEE